MCFEIKLSIIWYCFHAVCDKCRLQTSHNLTKRHKVCRPYKTTILQVCKSAFVAHQFPCDNKEETKNSSRARVFTSADRSPLVVIPHTGGCHSPRCEICSIDLQENKPTNRKSLMVFWAFLCLFALAFYTLTCKRYVFSVQGEQFICSQDKVLNNGRAETQVCSSKQGTDKLNRQILANVVNLLKTSVCAACASNSFVNVNTEIWSCSYSIESKRTF